MSWNGEIVIDLDSHVVERADRFYQDYIDPSYREAYQQLCDGVAQQAKAGHRYSLFGSRTSVIEQIETGRPLGTRDTFGLTRRSGMEGGRKAFPPGRVDALPPIRPEASWDVKVRIEDMDRAMVDVGVLYPTHVPSYCALRDGGFENALYRAYHRWVADFCAQAPKRLKWTLVANMRDVAAGVAEVKHWARDPNLAGIYAYGVLPEVEDLFQRQAREIDRAKREALLHQIQRVLHERVIHVPIYELSPMAGISARVEQAGVGLIPGHPYSAPYEDLQLKKP